MALWIKYLFLLTLIIQIIVLVLYLVTRITFVDFKDSMSNVQVVNSNIYQQYFSTLENELEAESTGAKIRGERRSDVPTFQNIVYQSSEARSRQQSKSEIFQSIDNKHAWLYSAFYDHVAAQDGRPLVRLYGIVINTFAASAIYCSFISEGRITKSVGSITVLPDNHRKRGLPCYLECPLHKDDHPKYISISFDKTGKPTNLLMILYPGPRIRNFTVCYSVLHSGFNMATQLIQSIEMNRILGAEHFVLYRHSISSTVNLILSRYQQDGIVTVFQWPLPTSATWSYAQMTALNDCIFRNRNTSTFVVVVDTDEFIVPRYNNNWMELIHNVSSQETDVSINSSKPHNLTGCFLVRSSKFIRNITPQWDLLPSQFKFNEDEKKAILKYEILPLSQFWRQKRIFIHGIRSKFIARPELVYISEIHLVTNFTSPNYCLRINETVALVHHYRAIVNNLELVNNTDMLKFKLVLYSRVMEQIKRFPEIFP